MASTSKRDSERTSKPRRASVKKAGGKRDRDIEELRRDRDELLAREATTSEILRLIAKAPADLQSVMDAIAENAARLCDASDVLVRRTDGNTYQTISHFGSIPTLAGRENVSIDDGSAPETMDQHPAERFATAGQSMSLMFRQLLTSSRVPRSMQFRQA